MHLHFGGALMEPVLIFAAPNLYCNINTPALLPSTNEEPNYFDHEVARHDRCEI